MCNLGMRDNLKENNVLTQWVDEHSDYLYSYALSRISNQELAKDFVQDTFFSAKKGFKKFKKESSERTWLTSILKNKIIDYFRKKSTTMEMTGKDETYFDPTGSWQYSQRPKNWDTGFFTEIERKEFRQSLTGCLSKLSKKSSNVFWLKNIDGLSSSEICKELGISSSNYWVIMHRSKLDLRACMEKIWMSKTN